jgi:hypothetical protein
VLHGLIAASGFFEDPFGWLGDAGEDARADVDARTVARSVVGGIEDTLASLELVDWVLLALAAALVAWVVASLRAITRLGPIVVEPLEHDGEGEAAAPIKALTTQLREKLSRTGLNPPPAVPAGTPRINLVDAVKESPVPQAAWLAALIDLVPRPRPSEYKVSGVLLEAEGLPPLQGPRGLRFAVVPAGEGRTELDTITSCGNWSDAVTTAASRIYLHVSQDATGAFPVWARWHEQSSLEAYVESCRLRTDQPQEAITRLEQAETDEPFNALATLQIANLYEQCRPTAGGPAVDMRARLQAHAVRRYLDVARDWPEIVEARYRLSVAAGALATALGDVTAATAGDIAAFLGVPGTDAAGLQSQLRYLARRETSAVLQLLRPWYALLTRLRLRTQFEPKGHQRRTLRRTVSISRHCLAMRRLVGKTGLRIALEVRGRSALVHGLHLGIGGGTATWQAHYNAACFDALLLDHLRKGGS